MAINNFGLSKRVQIAKLEDNHFAIVKKIKSRIILKDGYRILEQAEIIKSSNPEIRISLIITGPICSKTIKLLQENGIGIISRDR